MNDRRLFALRAKGLREFRDVGKLRLFLDDILGPERILPMVIGYPDFKKDWCVQLLSPLSNTDRLTVENYLEGVRAIEIGGVAVSPALKFKCVVIYSGIDRNHYSELDTKVLYVAVKSANERFSLSLYNSSPEKSGDDRSGYAAKSERPPSAFERACTRFVGPNVSYRTRLI